MREELLCFERALAKIVCSIDPIQMRADVLQNEALTEEQKRRIEAIDEDGLRITGLFVTKLRFERLLRGSSQAEQWFEEDPRSFSRAFKKYHQEVPPTVFFPPEEAKLFHDWMKTPSPKAQE